MSTYIKARSTTATGWQRPSDWIAIPSIAPGEQVFYGLVAVYDVIDGNRVAFTFAGNYTVDWGDGTPLENVLSGVKAEHSYDYSTVSNPTSEGWRQALIKVIPTGAANITRVDLQQTPTGISNGRTSQFMDIVMSVPNVTGASTNLVIGNGAIVLHRVVERIDIREIGAINSMSTMFGNCTSLQSVPLFNTASVTTMASMFSNCASLQSVPLFNTASVTSMFQMFINCTSLQSVPLFNTASVTTMAQMFSTASSIYAVDFNMANVTTTTNMFVSINSLQKFTATGLTRGISVANNLMSATEINNFFTSLGTASGAQTIVVTGNPGAATCDVTIATAKGFTVTI